MARGSGAEFTGDEGLGRYLDLHEHHQRFVSAHKTFGRKVSLGPLGCTAHVRALGGRSMCVHSPVFSFTFLSL